MAVASLVFSVIATLAAVVGVLLAFQSNQRAKEANRTSEVAVVHSGEANRIAGEANDLAEDANKVSHRALDVSLEQIEYSWRFEVDEDGTFVVSNVTAADALDVTVIVQEQHGHEVRASFEVLPAGGKVHLDAKGTLQEYFEEVLRARVNVVGFGPYLAVDQGRDPVDTKIRCLIKWFTPGGQERTGFIERGLCHRVTDHEGTIKRLD